MQLALSATDLQRLARALRPPVGLEAISLQSGRVQARVSVPRALLPRVAGAWLPETVVVHAEVAPSAAAGHLVLALVAVHGGRGVRNQLVGRVVGTSAGRQGLLRGLARGPVVHEAGSERLHLDLAALLRLPGLAVQEVSVTPGALRLQAGWPG